MPTTRSKAVVAFPTTRRTAWWSYMTQTSTIGLVEKTEKQGFTILAFDFSGLNRPSRP